MTPAKKLRISTLVALVTLCALALIAAPALAARPPDAGGGGGGGGGKGGGGGGKNVLGDLYGDLYVLERDGNGEPVRHPGGVGDLARCKGCLQPLAADCSFLPLLCTSPEFDPEEDDPCEIQPEVLWQAQEVHFGRLSVARSQETVLDMSYQEALRNINLAASHVADGGDGIFLDPARRLVLDLPIYAYDEFGVLQLVGEVEKTIDAPLENLGLYRELLTLGCLGPVETESRPGVIVETDLSETAAALLLSSPLELGHLVCPDNEPPTPEEIVFEVADQLQAAVFLAAAADKAGHVGLDMMINANTYVGVNPVDGQDVDYFDFEDPLGGWLLYDREATHPATIPAWLLSPISEDLFLAGDVYLFDPLASTSVGFVDLTVCRDGAPYDGACSSPDDPDGGCGGANWFAQAAEDARATIWFLHNWSVPEM